MSDFIAGKYFSPISVPWVCESYPSPVCLLIAASFNGNRASRFFLDPTTDYGKQCDLIQIHGARACARGLFVTDKIELAKCVLWAFNGNLGRMRIQGYKDSYFCHNYGDEGSFTESYRPQKFWVLHPDDMDTWDAHPAETAFVLKDHLRCMTQWSESHLTALRGNYTKAWYEGRIG